MDVLLYSSVTQTRTLVEQVLHRREHVLHRAQTFRQARQHLRTHKPQMAVLTPSKADADGLELARTIREASPETVVVFVCEPAPAQQLHDMFEAGADDCIFVSDALERLASRFGFIEQLSTQRSETAGGKRAQQQAVVAEIGRRGLVGTEHEVLMACAVRLVADVLGVTHCKVMEHDHAAGRLTLRAGVGWNEGAVGARSVHDGVRSQAGFTLRAGTPVVVEDLSTEARFEPPKLLAQHGIVSGVSVAIASTPQPYGILGAHDTTQRSFSEDDVYFMQSVANVLAGAVERNRTEQALRESEAKARAILETTVDGIITIDPHGYIQSFNAAAENIFGYSEAEVLDENVRILMPPPYEDEHDGYIRSYHETGRRRIIGIGREVTGQRKDGSTFPMELAVSEVRVGDRHLFTGIVRDISERRNLEKEVMNVSEGERQRIGQDLHDGLGQMLTGIGLLGQNLTRQLEAENHPRAEDAEEITSLVKEADQYARDLARGLTPVDLEASGLSKALQRLADNAERLFGVECDFDEVGTALVHNSSAATHMYRIAQESVSNAVRHGEASRIKIRLASGNEQIRLRVRDDGSGFDPETADGPGRGVHIMNYRARIIGGMLDISSNLGEGTVVTCTLPRSMDVPQDAANGQSGGAAS
jgi:PAS domain S-box-containing protein